MNTVVRNTLIAVAVVMLLAFVLYKYVYQPLKTDNLVLIQNNAKLNSTLQLLTTDNNILYGRVASLVNINDSLTSALKSEGYKVSTLTLEVIQLRQMILTNSGEVITPPSTNPGSGFGSGFTPTIPESMYGMKFAFSGHNALLNYTDTVTILQQPIQKLTLNYKPIPQKVYLSRDKEGIWSGHVEFPKHLQSMLTVTNLEIELEKDDFVGLMYNQLPTLFQFYGTLSTSLFKFDHYSAGGNFIINERYLVGYLKGIGDNSHIFNVGYKLFEVK